MDVTTWIAILGFAFVVLLAALGYASGIIVAQYERGVVLTLGRFSGIRHPGLRFIIPALQQIELVDMRDQVVDVAPQEIITKDNVLVRVNAVIYYRVSDPRIAILDVGNFAQSTKEMGQSVLREAVGSSDLDDLSSAEGNVANEVKSVLEVKTREWGVSVGNVEIKEINVDQQMVRSISRQAEAERNRRAAVIEASGELEAAQSFASAAEIMRKTPGAMYLRQLAAFENVASDKTNTIVFPLPVELADILGKNSAGDDNAAAMVTNAVDQVIKKLTDGRDEV